MENVYGEKKNPTTKPEITYGVVCSGVPGVSVRVFKGLYLSPDTGLKKKLIVYEYFYGNFTVRFIHFGRFIR